MTGGDTLDASGFGVVSILDGRYVQNGMYFDTYSRPTESKQSAQRRMDNHQHFLNGHGDFFIHELFTTPGNTDTEEEEPEAGPEQGAKEEEASGHKQGGSGWGTGECVVRTGWWGPPPSTVDVPQPNQNESGQRPGWTTGWGSNGDWPGWTTGWGSTGASINQGWGEATPVTQRDSQGTDKADSLDIHDEEGQRGGAK